MGEGLAASVNGPLCDSSPHTLILLTNTNLRTPALCASKAKRFVKLTFVSLYSASVFGLILPKKCARPARWTTHSTPRKASLTWSVGVVSLISTVFARPSCTLTARRTSWPSWLKYSHRVVPIKPFAPVINMRNLRLFPILFATIKKTCGKTHHKIQASTHEIVAVKLTGRELQNNKGQ